VPKRSGPNAGPATRDAVLDAARRLFTERGFDGTSMRDIAAEVGVTNAALYYHFPSKDAMLAALSQTRRDELEALAGWARTEGPRPGLLRETALRWLDGAGQERLDRMRLAQAIRPAMARAVPENASVPGGFEQLVEVFAGEGDAVERLRVRLVFDAFRAAAQVADPGDGLETIVAAARTMVLALTGADHDTGG
jgi:AcrR family transcriptional regulator